MKPQFNLSEQLIAAYIRSKIPDAEISIAHLTGGVDFQIYIERPQHGVNTQTSFRDFKYGEINTEKLDQLINLSNYQHDQGFTDHEKD